MEYCKAPQVQSEIHQRPDQCCNPPQSALPPCLKCNIASGVRTWNYAGPGAASKSVPAAPEE
eukprot:15433712-Alexandrium_andersonii.AAC.1